jgi:hypothetical protein
LPNTVAQDVSTLFSEAVKSACQSVIKAEPEITKYDTIAGDGDCGTCLKAGAEGKLTMSVLLRTAFPFTVYINPVHLVEILKAFERGLISEKDVPSAILGLAEAVSEIARP